MNPGGAKTLWAENFGLNFRFLEAEAKANLEASKRKL